MSDLRVRAERLVLVNWRGVFFAPLAMDKHVTALEGDNGAGKTTLLIATYVVLLPDLTRLRFTNLGEGDSTGGDRGIWGRLGTEGHLAYAWVRFRLPDGSSRLFGVQLRKGAEPAVELRHLSIRGLDDEVPLQEALLQHLPTTGEDLVPELDELRAAVTRCGGELEVYKTAKEYFAALFEVGVTPLRLTGEDARKRFNEVLRTSMTGGLSRGLTRDLRRFVLEAEDTLGSTLQRMQTNLDACHHSRLDVQRASQLQGEIRAVFEAGEAMFRGALHTARSAADGAGQTYEAQVEAAERARQQLADAERQAEVLSAREAAIDETLDDAKHALGNARGRRDRVRQAFDRAGKLAALEAEQPTLEAALEAAGEALRVAEVGRMDAKAVRTQRREALDEATRGLHDAEAGLEALQNRVARHQRARKALAAAREALAEPELAPEAAAERVPAVREGRAAVDGERRALRRRIDTAAQRRAEYSQAFEALTTCLGQAPEGNPAEAADGLLAEARRRQALQAQGPALATRVRQLEDVARRLGRLRPRLADVFGDQPPATSTAFDDELHAAERVAAEADAAVRERRQAAQGAEDTRRAARGEVATARAHAARVERLRSAVAGLVPEGAGPVDSAAGLRALHQRLEADEDEAREAMRAVEARGRAIGEAIQALDEGGRGLSEALQLAADAVDATPLRARFDDVPVEQAGEVEARLGPLVDALVVDDPYDAAEQWPADGPAPVWFVDHRVAKTLVDTRGGAVEGEGDAGVLARFGDAWYLGREPSAPVVGKAARARRRADLAAERQALDVALDGLQAKQSAVAAARRTCAGLLPEAELLDGPDPAEGLTQAQAGLEAADAAAQAAQADRQGAEQASRDAQARLAALRACAPDAALLDEPDPADALAAARADQATAKEAHAWLSANAKARERVAAGLADLRQPPPGPEQLDALRAELAAADGRRDALDAAEEALLAFAKVGDAYADEAAVAELDTLKLGQADARRRVTEAREREAQAEAALEGAEANWEAARITVRDADDAARRNAAERAGHQEVLTALGVGRPSEGDRSEAERAVTTANDRLEALNDQKRRLARDSGRVESQIESLGAALTLAQRQADEARTAWAPLRDRVQALSQAMAEHGLAEPTGEGPPGDPRVARATLVERLRQADRGYEIADEVEAAEATPEGLVGAWIVTRTWLRSCLPARLAESADPRQGLARLDAHLAGLAGRLRDQERRLAGSAEDVAHFVKQLRRRARRAIDRLNELLAPIAFGSIAGVRLEMTDIPEMEALLRGLSNQQDLFRPNVPIDQALDELFTRVGGRGGDGRRLFDYREYFELGIRVRRRGEDHWRVANPTKMSTGEAIGVGAALMMVVLHAWEAQNSLARRNSEWGTLRLLFLDEANRLSSDNLGVLFELCRTLDLQLLIAAPTVDEAAGNTTYRLVRVQRPGGGDEVRLTGRRRLIE